MLAVSCFFLFHVTVRKCPFAKLVLMCVGCAEEENFVFLGRLFFFPEGRASLFKNFGSVPAGAVFKCACPVGCI